MQMLLFSGVKTELKRKVQSSSSVPIDGRSPAFLIVAGMLCLQCQPFAYVRENSSADRCRDVYLCIAT